MQDSSSIRQAFAFELLVVGACPIGDPRIDTFGVTRYGRGVLAARTDASSDITGVLGSRTLLTFLAESVAIDGRIGALGALLSSNFGFDPSCVSSIGSFLRRWVLSIVYERIKKEGGVPLPSILADRPGALHKTCNPLLPVHHTDRDRPLASLHFACYRRLCAFAGKARIFASLVA